MDERMTEEEDKLETYQRLYKILQDLNQVSHDLQPIHESPDSDSPAIKALIDLQTASNSILPDDPHLSSLSHHLSELTDLVQEYHNSKPSNHGLKAFLIRRVRSQEFGRLASVIESELHTWIDCEVVYSVTGTLSRLRSSYKSSLNFSLSIDEEKLVNKMSALKDRLSRGFDMNLQDLLLKSGIFSELVWVLCDPVFPKRVREKAAISLQELVLFNKDVFVGSILGGGSVKALVSMGSLCSLQVLSSLIKAIKSPLVDEMESCGGILKIVSYLSSEDLEMRIMAMDCVMEIGYFGRKEAVEVMLNEDLIKRLVELQRSVNADGFERNGKCKKDETKRCLESCQFVGCVARFAVQLEVGEGLRQREKRAFKQQILSRVREACDSDAESATIVAEVLKFLPKVPNRVSPCSRTTHSPQRNTSTTGSHQPIEVHIYKSLEDKWEKIHVLHKMGANPWHPQAKSCSTLCMLESERYGSYHRHFWKFNL